MGKLEELAAEQTIYHKNLRRVAYVTAETAGRTPGEAVIGLMFELRDRPTPNGAEVVWAGEGEWKITLDVFRDLGLLVEELEQRVGSDLVVETTLGTVRRGKLLKYTNPGITIQLGPEHGSVELSMPRETISNVSVVLPPAEEATPPAAAAPASATTPAPSKTQPGASSAKKN